MTTLHYTQNIDLGEIGRIEATRDDSPEEVNFHLIAWKKGKQTHEIRLIYNIQYDYARYQHWWNGKLVEDYLDPEYHYGHLIEEGCSDLEGDFEPVSPLGCEMFQKGQWYEDIRLIENQVEIMFPYSPYGWDGVLQTEKIIKVKTIMEWGDRGFAERWFTKERGRLENLRFDPVVAREQRLHMYPEYSEWFGTEIPIDMRMVD